MGRVVDTAFGRMEVPIPEPWPNGGSTPGARVVHKAHFAFNTPGLLMGAPVVFTDGYAPAVGDILYNAWVQVDTAWDGTTPLFDVGNAAALAAFDGYFSAWAGGAFAGLPTTDNSNPWLENSLKASSVTTNKAIAQSITSTDARGIPAVFTAADPLVMVVTQDGSSSGADPGSTHGAAILYLETATPA